jgi:single-strand DNA-binding protein
MSINRVCVSGNLTADPELRQTAGGMSILNLRMAVNDRRKNAQSGEWEDFPNYVAVTVFGSRGESLARFLSKGSKVTVDGKLRYSEWDDKDSGKKRSKLEIIADDVDLPPRSGNSAPAQSHAMPEEDIPF